MKEKRRITSDGYFEISKDGGKNYTKTTMKPTRQEYSEWNNIRGFVYGGNIEDDNGKLDYYKKKLDETKKKYEEAKLSNDQTGMDRYKDVINSIEYLISAYSDNNNTKTKLLLPTSNTNVSTNPTTPTTKKGGIAEKYKYTAPSIDEMDRGDDVVVPGTPKKAMPNITPLESDEYAVAQLQGKQTGQTPFEKSLTYDKTTPTTNRYGAGLETLLGAAQAGYGLQQLMKDKRPVDKIDPTFSRLTDEAVAASRYGFTPEQRAALNQDIVNTRIAQQAKINQLAGGSAGVGLANVRAALNEELMNKYKLAAQDEQLRMQKAQQAAGMAGQRAGMSRALFADKMNEFMQKQQAGAELLGAGIQNVVGARRYQREREAQDQINKMMYGNTNLG